MHESKDLDGQRVREWFCGKKSITVFGDSDGIKCWGPNIHTEFEDFDASDPKILEEALEWLRK